MSPAGLIPADALGAGEVGYITASIKTVADTQVGDTITTIENPAAEPLPGYRPVQPMVFSGVYPADGGVWKLEATRNVAAYCENALKDLIDTGAVVVIR